MILKENRVNNCEICGNECSGKTCSGSCRAKLQRRTRTEPEQAHAHGRTVKAHAPNRTTDTSLTDLAYADHSELTPALDVCHDNYATRTNPERLNYGDYMTSDQLKQSGLTANRVPIPGDSDYKGVCVKQGGTWAVMA